MECGGRVTISSRRSTISLFDGLFLFLHTAIVAELHFSTNRTPTSKGCSLSSIFVYSSLGTSGNKSLTQYGPPALQPFTVLQDLELLLDLLDDELLLPELLSLFNLVRQRKQKIEIRNRPSY